jgi:hypothetical protein
MSPLLDIEPSQLYIAVVVTLIFIVGVADLVLDYRTLKPKRTYQIKEAAADFGIALAERTKGPSDLKLRNAVDFATDYCAQHKTKTTRNEMTKIIEIRLPQKPKLPPSPTSTP